MQSKHNKQLVPFAKQLRKEMTKEERHLWYDFLRTYPIRFSRQKILGKYIADFYSAEAKLVIELDGSGHFHADGIEYDRWRDAFMTGQNIRVLRFSNYQIDHEFASVCTKIELALSEPPQSASLTAPP